MWFEIYVFIGTSLAVLNLYAKKKLEDPITRSDLLAALITIFAWLPFLIYFAVKLYRDYKRMQEDREMWEKMIERAIEKAFEEIEEEMKDEERSEKAN